MGRRRLRIVTRRIEQVKNETMNRLCLLFFLLLYDLQMHWKLLIFPYSLHNYGQTNLLL